MSAFFYVFNQNRFANAYIDAFIGNNMSFYKL